MWVNLDPCPTCARETSAYVDLEVMPSDGKPEEYWACCLKCQKSVAVAITVALVPPPAPPAPAPVEPKVEPKVEGGPSGTSA